MRPRPTLRLRLTLLYGGLLVGVGVVLILLSYLLLSRALAADPKFDPTSVVFVPYRDGRVVPYNLHDLQAYFQGEAKEQMLKGGFVALGVVSVVGLAGGYLLAGRALRPLHRVTATARRLSTETLDERIALRGPDDELKELADTFDGMIARLQAAFDSQRRFVANASHELRTPLSVMRTEVDVTLSDPDAPVDELRHMGQVVRDATQRATRLVDALLVLARTDASARAGLPEPTTVELPAVAKHAIDAVAREIDHSRLRVQTQLDPAAVQGDPGLLERLAGNLVENAIRHNVPGGWLQVRTYARNGHAALVVANSGERVTPEEVPGLFEPFRRAGSARTAARGAGLGLSIVRAVVLAHGGTVDGRALPDGGLEVVAILPTG